MKLGQIIRLTVLTLALALNFSLVQPAQALFTNTAPLNVARIGHTATLLNNGRVLVTGGRGTNYNSIALAELYDPLAGTWTPTGATATPRKSHAATLHPNGKVLVTGGSDGTNALLTAEIFDAGTGTWTPTGSMTQ